MNMTRILRYMCAAASCLGAAQLMGSEYSHHMFIALMGPPQTQLSIHDKAELCALSRDYDHKIDCLNAEPIYMIPHTIHVIWLGPKNFPESSIQNMISWKTHHPEWQFIFWTDNESRPVPIPGMSKRLIQEYDFGILSPYIAHSDHWGEKSDMMRYTILFNEGGIYVDHDAFCEWPVDDLIDHFEFIAGCDPSQPHPGIESTIIINNSIIASCPHHPVLRATIEQIAQVWVEAEKHFPGSDCESTFARVLRRTLVPFIAATRDGCCQSSNRTLILPASYFYSLGVIPENTFEEMKKEGFIYAVHMHDASHVR